MAHFITWDKAYCLFPVALKTKVTYLVARMLKEDALWHDEFCRELQDFSDGFTLKSGA